jgi:hypothetical protein
MRATRERLLPLALMAIAVTAAFVLLMDQLQQTAGDEACRVRAEYR